MTEKECSQLKMLSFLQVYFYKRNKEFCESIPALKIILKHLILRLEKLENITIKGGRGTAYRETKLHARQNLCESAFLVSSGLLAFANLTKNKLLRNAVNYCYSDFFRSVESEMLNRCKQVLRTAHRTKALSFVGFDENLVIELRNNIQKYEKLMLEKDESKKETMKYNFLISKTLLECMKLLENKLSPLMKMLSKKYPDSYRDYLASIQITQKAGRKKKRNKNKKANILLQKSPKELIHRFAELAIAE